MIGQSLPRRCRFTFPKPVLFAPEQRPILEKTLALYSGQLQLANNLFSDPARALLRRRPNIQGAASEDGGAWPGPAIRGLRAGRSYRRRRRRAVRSSDCGRTLTRPSPASMPSTASGSAATPSSAGLLLPLPHTPLGRAPCLPRFRCRAPAPPPCRATAEKPPTWKRSPSCCCSGPAAVLSPPEAEPEVNNEHQPGAEANELDEELEERPDCGSDSLLVHLSLTALK